MARSSVSRGHGDNRLAVLAEEVKAAHGEILRASDTIADRALKAGHALIEAKASLGHGKFGAWLAEIGLPARTATRYMALAELDVSHEDKTAIVADLGLVKGLDALRRPIPDPKGGEVIVGHEEGAEKILYIWRCRDGWNVFIITCDLETNMLAGAPRGFRSLDRIWPHFLVNGFEGFDLNRATFTTLKGKEAASTIEAAEELRQSLREGAIAGWAA